MYELIWQLVWSFKVDLAPYTVLLYFSLAGPLNLVLSDYLVLLSLIIWHLEETY